MKKICLILALSISLAAHAQKKVVAILTDTCNLSGYLLAWSFDDHWIIKKRLGGSQVDSFKVESHFLMFDDSVLKVAYYVAAPSSFAIVYDKKFAQWIDVVPQEPNKEIDVNKIYPILSYEEY